MNDRTWPWRRIAGGLLVTILLQTGVSTVAQAQQASIGSSAQDVQSSDPSESSSVSPGVEKSEATYPDAPVAQSVSSNSAGQSQGQQDDHAKPLGTAAAPYSQPSGVMGSRPAGAVIAPGKQRRIHAIVISVALIAAAGIAIGTVAALSQGSPSRP
ncbi:MAG TPA: hypothetical protein VHW46_00985 [Terracidiphilus sp.]|jgi:hypothetical protein|nr:hypothetical protein [Terracidiphilus sp.]